MGRRTWAALGGVVALSMAACGGGGGGSGAAPAPAPGPGTLTITDLRVTAQTVTSTSLAWTATNAGQFRIYRTMTSRAAGGAVLIGTSDTPTFTDTTAQPKEAYTYEVLACRSTTDADSACSRSLGVFPYDSLLSPYGAFYAPRSASVDAAAMAADLGLVRVGARFVFADAADASNQPVLDYTLREVIGNRLRLTLTSASYTDPLSTVGEITLDGRVGPYLSGIVSAAASVLMPYAQGYDYGVVEPLIVTGTPAVGQQWQNASASSTDCTTLDGRPGLCVQTVLVTTRLLAATERFADLCPHSPMSATLPALKAYKIEQTFAFTPQRPDVFRAEPGYVQTSWLAAGHGVVARQRVNSGAGTIPKLGTGNYCLVAASGL